MQATNTQATNTQVKKATSAPASAPVSLLAQLQASAPASVSNAQLSALIVQVQGAYAPVQNGISVPLRGTHCVNVWCVVLQYCVTHKQIPNLQQTQALLVGTHSTTVSVQRAKVLKYLGITK